MRKKWLFNCSLILLVVASIILLNEFVFAQPYASGAYSSGGFGMFGFDIRQGSYDLINFVVNWAEPFLQVTLGGYDYSGYLLFEKFLLFILLMSVIYVSVKRIPVFKDQNAVIWTISIIVPLLSVRFLNFIWLNTIFLQYQVLGVALAGILPFIIFLFFVHSALADYPAVRKIAWVFFIVVYYGLWSTSEVENYGVIYFWTMVISLAFLLLDGTIHRYLDKQKWNDSFQTELSKAIARLQSERRNIQASNMPTKQKILDGIDRDIAKLVKRLS